jgi:hypothetical protein
MIDFALRTARGAQESTPAIDDARRKINRLTSGRSRVKYKQRAFSSKGGRERGNPTSVPDENPENNRRNITETFFSRNLILEGAKGS